MNKNMKLNIKELLDFFDDKKDSQKGDANAIMAILGEELNAAVYKHFRNNKVEILSNSVLPGTVKGKWLDRWIVDIKNKKLYQCEIKNWAATAIGGKQLKSNANNEEIKKVVNYYWNRELKIRFSKELEHPNHVTKVLLKMKSPKEFEKLKVEPLVIYWMPVSSDKNGLNPSSILSLKGLNLIKENKFTELNIFSVSLYIRELYRKGKKIIELDMPCFEHRVKLLNNLSN